MHVPGERERERETERETQTKRKRETKRNGGGGGVTTENVGKITDPVKQLQIPVVILIRCACLLIDRWDGTRNLFLT